jgi:hypothetical protein
MRKRYPFRLNHEDADYKVGPGCPPKEYRFKPGQSGNPKGAPRKVRPLTPEFKEIFVRALNKKAKLTQGERERSITMFAAGMEQLAVQFAKGCRHARRDVFWIAKELGIDLLGSNTIPAQGIAWDRRAILDGFLERAKGEKTLSAGSPVIASPELRDDDLPDEGDEER